jgi:putative redox protein
MRSERFDFPGASGHTLAGRLELPEGLPMAYAIFAHCFTCGKDVTAAARIAWALADRGIAVLRFDFTGLGSSGGEFANTNFSSNVADLVAASDHLRRTRAAPSLLVGHSFGGAAVLAAASDIPEVRAVVTIGAPFDPAHVRHLLRDDLATIEATGEAQVTLAGRSFPIRRQFLEDLASRDQVPRIANLRRALLVLHAPRDETVGIENAQAIFLAARHPKSFVSLDDADHLLTRRADAAYVADLLACWAARYVRTSDDMAAPGEGLVTVTETGEGKFQQAVAVGPHHLIADEPVASGGLGSGPSPYDLLLAGLGACTSMTLRLYADQKGWPLERVAVTLAHRKLHAADCADCETKEGRVDEIERTIALDGPLDPIQRARLLEIADKCPVHRTLHGEIRVRTREKGLAQAPAATISR